jgi:hypothetical protein
MVQGTGTLQKRPWVGWVPKHPVAPNRSSASAVNGRPIDGGNE